MSAGESYIPDLIDLVMDSSATDEQLQDFARLIDERPELLTELAEELFMHSLLQRSSEKTAWPTGGSL